MENNEWVDDILRPLLYTVGNAMNETTVLTKRDFRRERIVPLCLKVVLQQNQQQQHANGKEGVKDINEIVLENVLFIMRFSSMNDIVSSPQIAPNWFCRC